MDKEKALYRIGTLGVGLACNQIIDWCFNFVLYPFVMVKCGLVVGTITMTFLSFLACYATIVFYDWSKVDWIGIESLKNLRENERTGLVGKFTRCVFQKGDFAAMLFLSIKFDPFITTAYMRRGVNQYNGLSQRDWRIFIGSLLVGNAYWSFMVFSGVTFVGWLFNHFNQAVTTYIADIITGLLR